MKITKTNKVGQVECGQRKFGQGKYGQGKYGFSLVELSIVMFTIGLLIVAVVKGSDLIAQARLSAARELTAKSPVPNINGLVLWYETTLASSFIESEVKNNNLVSTWKDISGATANNPKNATQASSSYQPTYKETGISNLPSLSFSGVPESGGGSFNYLAVSGGSASKLISGQTFTMFIVYQINISGTAHYFIGHQDGWTRWRVYQDGFQSNKSGAAFATASAINTPSIISIVGSDTSISLYRNGTLSNTGSLTTGNYTENNGVWIGGTQLSPSGAFSLNGMLGEIIIYNRIIKTQERQDIERYLGKKWGITVP